MRGNTSSVVGHTSCTHYALPLGHLPKVPHKSGGSLINSFITANIFSAQQEGSVNLKWKQKQREEIRFQKVFVQWCRRRKASLYEIMLCFFSENPKIASLYFFLKCLEGERWKVKLELLCRKMSTIKRQRWLGHGKVIKMENCLLPTNEVKEYIHLVLMSKMNAQW